MTLRFTSLLIIFLLGTLCHGQIAQKSLVDQLSISASATPSIKLTHEETITAIAIKCKVERSFKCRIGDQLVTIPKDEDAEDPTYFISLPVPTNTIELIISADAPFDLYLIKSGQARSADHSRKAQSDVCFDPPSSIHQSNWRQGLPAPNYARVFHDVLHQVVHHSAGSNTNSNYTQVVRDIYLYHTQVNGWSDIGYNYLIAQDGTIFNGRDPGEGSQDHVRGAHFCGANTGTLGICLLGNYETTTPSEPAWLALQRLLTYEFLLHDLDLFEAHNHSLGRLGTLVGHRDGCATLCPGENVYSMLQELKSTLDPRISECKIGSSLAFQTEETLIAANQPITLVATGNYDRFDWNLPGAIPENPSGSLVEVFYPTPGFYDLELVGTGTSQTDTLWVGDFIQVSQLANSPILYPNPIEAFQTLEIDFREEIQKVTVYDLAGHVIQTILSNKLSTFGYLSGTYIVEVQTSIGSFRKKLIVL